MKGLIFYLFLIFAILIALLFILQPKPEEPEEYEAVIQVIDADTEEPIKSAKVKIKCTDETVGDMSLSTNSDGECSFEFSDPEEILTLVSAGKSGYEKAKVEDLELAYFEEETLIIPLKKVNVIDEGREIGAQGRLKVTLLWEDETVDLDLHIRQPNGFEISYLEGHKMDEDTGGELDVDWIPGNPENPENIGENIFWQTPPRGQYKVWVECFNPEEAPACPCNVIIYRENEEPQVFHITVQGYKDVQQVTTFTIN